MSGEETLRALVGEIRALAADGRTIPSIEQLADAIERVAERVGYSDWEDRMGEDL